MSARVPSLPRVQQRWWQQRDQTKSSAGVRSEAETETLGQAGAEVEESRHLAIPLGQRVLRRRKARWILAESGLTAPTLRRARGGQTELSPLHEPQRMDWQKQEVPMVMVVAEPQQVATQAQ